MHQKGSGNYELFCSVPEDVVCRGQGLAQGTNLKEPVCHGEVK